MASRHQPPKPSVVLSHGLSRLASRKYCKPAVRDSKPRLWSLIVGSSITVERRDAGTSQLYVVIAADLWRSFVKEVTARCIRRSHSNMQDAWSSYNVSWRLFFRFTMGWPTSWALAFFLRGNLPHVTLNILCER